MSKSVTVTVTKRAVSKQNEVTSQARPVGFDQTTVNRPGYLQCDFQSLLWKKISTKNEIVLNCEKRFPAVGKRQL